ncbi:MAG: hypothetical protein AABY22_18060 [Nanoarchaeota archaeon]
MATPSRNDRMIKNLVNQNRKLPKVSKDNKKHTKEELEEFVKNVGTK